MSEQEIHGESKSTNPEAVAGELMQARYPELNLDGLLDDEAKYFEMTGRLNADGRGEPKGSDFEAIEPRWQIEQRLAAINDARESGAIDQETADRLELATLRELREITLRSKIRIPTLYAHEIAKLSGDAPLNVPQ